MARGVGHPRRHAADHAARRARRDRRCRPSRDVGRARARDEGLPVHGVRQPPVRRWHDAHRRAGLPPPARGDRDGCPPHRAAGRDVHLRHDDRQGHHVRAAPAGLRRDRHHGRRHGRRRTRCPWRGSRRRRLRRRLHEAGQPRRAARGQQRRRRHRRWLHRHGLLADQPAARRRERDDRLPPDPVGARRRRGGARRDRARGRPDGVPRQPDRGARRGRQGHRRQVHPQPPGRARCVRPSLADPHRRLGVHRSPPRP